MDNKDYDLFVLGAGSGGVRAARMAASFGARVAVAEDRYMGGTCVNVGCVPKKLYVYASEFGPAVEDARGFGWTSAGFQFDWATLRDHKKREIRRLNGIYRQLLQDVEVDIFDGRATILGPNRVAVDGVDYRADKLLIATGGWPYVPPFPGSELAVTSNEIFDLEAFPQRLVIVGGGYIAAEFAGIFNGLGAQVSQLYRGELFLRGFDQDIRRHAAREIAKSGVDLRFNSQVTGIARNGGDAGVLVSTADGDTLAADTVLYATGRKPRLQDLGLENTAVRVNEQGHIEAGQDYQTDQAGIFALGDVTGGLELTPVALAEGMAFARQQFQPATAPMEYDFIPSAVFCQPNIGTVGFTEEQARQEFGEIRLYQSEFKPMKHTLSGRDEYSFMKLIVDAASDRVVGAHMVGADAGEIMQGISIALKAGATKATFDSTIGIHPTAAEELVTMRTPWTG